MGMGQQLHFRISITLLCTPIIYIVCIMMFLFVTKPRTLPTMQCTTVHLAYLLIGTGGFTKSIHSVD